MVKKGILAFFRLIIALYFVSNAEAKVLDHIKPVGEKMGEHSMRNIDFIYMINLDQRPEKWAKSIEQLAPYGIVPHRFAAVNGWELTLEEINDIGVKFAPGMDGSFASTYYPLEGTGTDRDYINEDKKQPIVKEYGRVYFTHCLSRGAIGCVLSHLSVLKDAYDSGYDTIWVMEDDVEVMRDPRILSNLIDSLDKLVGRARWDIFFTDRDFRDAKGRYVPCRGMAKRPNFKPKSMSRFYIDRVLNKNFRRLGARFGSCSMIIRRSGIKKLLDFYEEYQLYLPYDLDNYLPEKMRFITVLDDVVSNICGGASDIARPTYQLTLRKNIK